MSRTIGGRKRTLSPDVPERIADTDGGTVAVQRDCLPAVQAPVVHGRTAGGNGTGPDAAGPVPETTLPRNEGQRDLLVELLREAKVDCVICYDRARDTERIWSCRSCYQIMHLKCVTVWYMKSHRRSAWRCPACQSRFLGKPSYFCFCGSMLNPFPNGGGADLPHSCGQMCAQRKKNSNPAYNDCRHKCTLLCHPGPCPKCTERVTRKCACAKTEVTVQCGQSTPVLCSSVCQKTLPCRKHVCQKRCHAKQCDPCKSENCPEIVQIDPNRRDPIGFLPFAPGTRYNSRVTDEELRALGLNPEEFVQGRSGGRDDDTEEDEDDDRYGNDGRSGVDVEMIDDNEGFVRDVFDTMMDSMTSSDSSNRSLDDDVERWSDEIPESNDPATGQVSNRYPDTFTYTSGSSFFADDSSDTDTDNDIGLGESDRMRIEEMFGDDDDDDDDDSMENEEGENSAWAETDDINFIHINYDEQYYFSSRSSDSSESSYSSIHISSYTSSTD